MVARKQPNVRRQLEQQLAPLRRRRRRVVQGARLAVAADQISAVSRERRPVRRHHPCHHASTSNPANAHTITAHSPRYAFTRRSASRQPSPPPRQTTATRPRTARTYPATTPARRSPSPARSPVHILARLRVLAKPVGQPLSQHWTRSQRQRLAQQHTNHPGKIAALLLLGQRLNRRHHRHIKRKGAGRFSHSVNNNSGARKPQPLSRAPSHTHATQPQSRRPYLSPNHQPSPAIPA